MRYHEQLEADFANWMGIPDRHYVACSSGTAALHLAIEALQLPERANIMLPDFTMVACARAIRLARRYPSFVDIDSNLLIDFDWIKRRHTRQTAAIVAVHMYGRTVNMARLQELASKRGYRVIEDCAEAHGAPGIGEFSDAACWSFYSNKIIHGEEGGMVSFRDERHANLARQLRSLGFTEDHNFMHIPFGHNYRLSDIHAWLILKSLKAADTNIKIRFNLEEQLDELIPAEFRMPVRDAVWVYDVRIPGLQNIDELVKWMNQQGVKTRCGFKPMSAQPEFVAENDRLPALHLVNSWSASREVLYFQVWPLMTEEYIRKIGDVFRKGVETVASF